MPGRVSHTITNKYGRWNLLNDKCSKEFKTIGIDKNKIYGIWKIVSERVESSSENFRFAYTITLFNHSSDARRNRTFVICLYSKEAVNGAT